MIKFVRGMMATILLLTFVLCSGCGLLNTCNSCAERYAEIKEKEQREKEEHYYFNSDLYNLSYKQDGCYINDGSIEIDLERSGFYYGDDSDNEKEYYYCSCCKNYLDCDNDEFITHFVSKHTNTVDTRCPFCNVGLKLEESSKENALREHLYLNKCCKNQIVKLPTISESFANAESINNALNEKYSKSFNKIVYYEFNFTDNHHCTAKGFTDGKAVKDNFFVAIEEKSPYSIILSKLDENGKCIKTEPDFTFNAKMASVSVGFKAAADTIYDLDVPESFDEYKYVYYIVYKTPRIETGKPIYYDKIECFLSMDMVSSKKDEKFLIKKL